MSNVIYAKFGAAKRKDDFEAMLTKLFWDILAEFRPDAMERTAPLVRHTMAFIHGVYSAASLTSIRLAPNGELAELDPQVLERLAQQTKVEYEKAVQSILAAAEVAIVAAATGAVTAVVGDPSER